MFYVDQQIISSADSGVTLATKMDNIYKAFKQI